MGPKKKEVVDSRKELLRKLILVKLNSIRKKKFEPKTIDKFSLVFRIFLLRYLNLNYEFTLDELIKELNKAKISNKLKERIIALSTLFVEVEYEEKKISREEFKSVLSEAEGIINLATGKVEEEKEIEKKGEKAKKILSPDFLHKIGLFKTGEEKKIIKERKKEKQRKKEKKKKPLEPTPTSKKKISDIELIKKSISQSKAMLIDSDFDNAKKTYINIMKIYMSMSPKDQAKVHKNIKNLYHERKRKENLGRIKRT